MATVSLLGAPSLYSSVPMLDLDLVRRGDRRRDCGAVWAAAQSSAGSVRAQTRGGDEYLVSWLLFRRLMDGADEDRSDDSVHLLDVWRQPRAARGRMRQANRAAGSARSGLRAPVSSSLRSPGPATSRPGRGSASRPRRISASCSSCRARSGSAHSERRTSRRCTGSTTRTPSRAGLAPSANVTVY